MDRRRATSGPPGLSQSKALQKLKRELTNVITDLKAGGGNGTGRRHLRSESSVGANESVAGDEEEEVGDHPIGFSTAKKTPFRISTAIPFDYWSVGLLAASIALLLVSQVMCQKR